VNKSIILMQGSLLLAVYSFSQAMKCLK